MVKFMVIMVSLWIAVCAMFTLLYYGVAIRVMLQLPTFVDHITKMPPMH